MEVPCNHPVQQVGESGEKQKEYSQQEALQIVPVIKVIEAESHGKTEEAEQIGDRKNIMRWKPFHAQTSFCIRISGGNLLPPDVFLPKHCFFRQYIRIIAQQREKSSVILSRRGRYGTTPPTSGRRRCFRFFLCSCLLSGF